MKLAKIKVITSTILLTTIFGQASAGVINFENFTNFTYDGAVADLRDRPLSIDGFTFSVGKDVFGSVDGDAGIFKSGYEKNSNGTNFMYNQGRVVVTSQSSVPFSITSIDLVAAPSTVTLIGFHSDGTSASWTPDIEGIDTPVSNPFVTYAVTGLTNLTSFQIVDTGSLMYADNITYIPYSPPATAVPEPSTYAMLLAGLGLVGFVARRRASRA